MATDILIADPVASDEEPIAPIASSVALEASVDLAGTATRADSDASPSAIEWFRDYVQLTKPRIVTMILVTSLMTAMIGSAGEIGTIRLLWLLLGTGLVAASAGAANQVWERVIDGRMRRTASRPLPGGRVGVNQAIAFTVFLGIAGVLSLQLFVGWVPMLASLATWLLYVLVYTPMKTRTSWNTTVGAVAGALPVLIGYTAEGGLLSDWTGWLLVGVLVAWQYPHFMAIAWMYRRQYGEAGFQMTTTVEPTGRSAGWQSVVGSVALIACGIALAWMPGGFFWPIAASIGVVLAGYPMLIASVRFLNAANDSNARKLLRSSLLVLPAVLLIVTLRVWF